MAKAPAFQFYPGDWRRDTQVQMLSMATRGVWFEMLCCMWDAPDRGKLTGTVPQLARLIGCSEQELRDALHELSVTKTGDVTECNDLVTVINRRMYREDRERKSTRLRVQRHRVTQESGFCNGDVTLPSSSSSSSSIKSLVIEGGSGGEILGPVDNSEPEPEEECPPFEPVETQEPEKPKAALEAKPENQDPKPRPAPNCNRWTVQTSDKRDQLLDDIRARYGMNYHGRVMSWVRNNLTRANPEAMVRCLERLISDRLAGKSITVPERWLEAALSGTKEGKAGENGKAEAAEFDREQQEIKRPVPGEFVAVGGVLAKAIAMAAQGG